MQAAIELGIDEVPVVFKTKENPVDLVPMQKPAKIDVSGLETSTNYSFSDIDFESRIRSPKESAKEMQERGGTVFMGENDTFSDRKSSKYYTPMREEYYRKTE